MPVWQPFQGGTGQSTYKQNEILIGDGATNGLDKLAIPTPPPTPGNSGGVVYYNTPTSLASSVTLAGGGLVVGGGVGSGPFVPLDAGTVIWSITSNTLQGTANANNAAPISATPQLQITGADTVQNGIQQDSYGNYNYHLFRRADGTQASPSGLVANDVIGAILAQGYTSLPGYQANTSAAIELIAAGTWSNTSIPSQIEFFATNTASVTASLCATMQPAGAGGQLLVGNTSGVTVAPGNVGEPNSTVLTQGSEISLSTGVTANIITQTIQPGIWLVFGEVWFDTSTGGAAAGTRFAGGISLTSATLPASPAGNLSRADLVFANAITGTNVPVVALAPCIIPLGAATSVFLVARATFSAGAVSAYGKLTWLRVQ